MTIEIHRPELEALIVQRMKSGPFHKIEDALMQALETAPAPETRTETAKTFGKNILDSSGDCLMIDSWPTVIHCSKPSFTSPIKTIASLTWLPAAVRKAVVAAVLERGGKVRAKVVGTRRKSDLQKLVRVRPDRTCIATP